MKTKSFLPPIFLLLLFHFNTALADKKPKKGKEIYAFEDSVQFKQQIDTSSIQSKDSIYALINRICSSKKSLNRYKNFLDSNGVIVFISTTPDGDPSKVLTNVLAKETNKNNSNWTEYIDRSIFQKPRILFVLLGKNQSFYDDEFYIKNEKSAMIKELTETFAFAKGIVKNTMGPVPNPSTPVRFVEIAKSKFLPPCKIWKTFQIVDGDSWKKDSVCITVHEKIFLSFRIGLASTQFDRNVFKISNNQLIVSPDSAKKVEWKENLICMVQFHPIARTDRYNPKFTNYDKYNGFQRIALFGGFNISLDPLKTLYAGASYELSNYFTLFGGMAWRRVPTNNSNIGNITDVDEAIKYAHQKYEPGQFTFGLAFKPSVISDILNK